MACYFGLLGVPGAVLEVGEKFVYRPDDAL